MQRSPLSGALDGVRVLDLTRLLPGPFLTMVLADLGADVVKVEDPRLGDYLRAMPPQKHGIGGRYAAVNRGKRSMTLDLKQAAARDAFLRMCERADVVVESFRPGVMERLGLGYEALRARNRGIILCSLTGFGQDGPYRDRAAHDVNYVGLTGVLALTGNRGGAPVLPGVQIADFAGGAMWGLSGILAALWQRDKHGGNGAHLDISMTEGVLAFLASELGNLWAGGSPVTRGVGILTGGAACYGLYRTADDRYLSLGALEPKFWEAFNRVIGRGSSPQELLLPPAEQERIRGEIQAILAKETLSTWRQRLQAADCCCEPVLELDEVEPFAQHVAREMVFVIDGPKGEPLKQLRTPLGRPVAATPPPGHGQHTREVLLEYGFTAAEVAALGPAA